MITGIKPGDLVRIWEGCADGEDCFSKYVFVAQNEEAVIVSSDPVGYDGSISQYLMDETLDMDGVSVYVFDQERVDSWEEYS